MSFLVHDEALHVRKDKYMSDPGQATASLLAILSFVRTLQCTCEQ